MLEVTVKSKKSEFTLDCGAEANLITAEECRRLGIKFSPTRQCARMADGETFLDIIGEVYFTAVRGHHSLIFNGLVVKESQLDKNVLAGVPFLSDNKVTVDFSANIIMFWLRFFINI